MLKRLILKSLSIAHQYFSLGQLSTHQVPWDYLERSIPQTTPDCTVSLLEKSTLKRSASLFGCKGTDLKECDSSHTPFFPKV